MKFKRIIFTICVALLFVCVGGFLETFASSNINFKVDNGKCEESQVETQPTLLENNFDIYLPEHFTYKENEPSVVTGFSRLAKNIIGDRVDIKMSLPNIENVKEVSDFAFDSEKAIASVYIPSNITKIGTFAFSHDENLVDIRWEEGEENLTLVSQTFFNLKNLENLYIPARVSEIDGGCFGFCPKLKTVRVALENQNFSSNDNGEEINAVINVKSKEIVVGCQNTIVPNYVESIGKQSFSGVKGLTTLLLPDSLIKIKTSSFAGSSIQTIKIPDNVENIGQQAFSGCQELISVAMPNNDVELGEDVFKDCQKLECIIAPSKMMAEKYISSTTQEGFQNGSLEEQKDKITYIIRLNFELLSGNRYSEYKLFQRDIDWTLLENGTWDKKSFIFSKGEWFNENSEVIDIKTLAEEMKNGELTEETTFYEDASLLSSTKGESLEPETLIPALLLPILLIIELLVFVIYVRVKVKKPEEIE